MELKHDYRTFQNFFRPRRMKGLSTGTEVAGALYFVLDEDRVLCGFSDREDLSEWIGASVEEVKKRFEHRDLYLVPKARLDSWVEEALQRGHYDEQGQTLRRLARSEGAAPRTSGRHFLVDAIESSWWSRIFPASFGVWIRIEDQPSRDLAMVFRMRKLDLYQRPDLSGMGNERSRQPEEVVKYLSEYHMVPFQGLVVSISDWMEWCVSNDPWAEVWRSIRENQARMFPKNRSLTALVALRGMSGI